MAELENNIKVDTIGTPVITAFNIELFSVPVNSVDRIQIQAIMTFVSLPSETVIFKKNGSWGFSPNNPTWLTLQTPTVVNGSDPNFRESISFAANLTVSNENVNVDFEVTTTDTSNNLLTDETFTITVQTDFPISPSGIAAEKKVSIHTFTDFDLLPAQDGTKNYGPDSSNPTTEYRTWVTFPTTTNILKAYAVSDGEFFIQEVTANSNVVNLVLKPDRQPESNFGHVRYFVYRGLKKGSFLDSGGNVLPANTSGLSQVLSRMWTVRTNLNAEAGVNEVLERNDLALDDGPNILSPTELVEDVFERFVFQRLTPGWTLGEFDTSGDYGFQVVMEGPGSELTLADLRVLDHKIAVTSQFPSAEDDISVKLEREKILNYLDIAAYFGLLANGKVELHTSSGSQTLNSISDVYTNVITKFATANLVYIDIRDELNNSLNFFGSYSDANTTANVANILFRDASNAFNPVEYHSSGWPILALDTSNTSLFAPNSSDAFIATAFQLPQGDNNLPTLFLSGSSFYTDALNYKEKFALLTPTSGFTDAFELSVLNDAAASAVLPFALKFAYSRRYDTGSLATLPSTLTRIWKDDHIDNLLSPVDVNVTVFPGDPTNQTNVAWRTKDELKYLGWTSIVGGRDFTVRSGIAKDSIGEVVFSYFQGGSEEAGATINNNTHASLDLEKGRKESKSFFLMLRDVKKLLRVGNFSLSTSVDVIQLDSIVNQYSSLYLEKSTDDMISVAYTASEKGTIQNSISQFMAGSDCFYVALNHGLANDANDIPYFVFSLGVQGIVFDANTLTYDVQRLDTGILFYSLDGKSYFTTGYTNALSLLI